MSTILTDEEIFETTFGWFNTEALVDFLYAAVIILTLMGLGYAASLDGMAWFGSSVTVVGIWGVATLYWQKTQRLFR